MIQDLFAIQTTGLSNEGMKRAADALLGALGPGQREDALFSVDSDTWRRWSNIHVFMMRHGAMLEAMELREGFSPSGFELARNIMKLNESICRHC